MNRVLVILATACCITLAHAQDPTAASTNTPPAPVYAGFQPKELDSAQVPAVYDQNADDFRANPRYGEWNRALLAARSEDVSAQSYVEALLASLTTLEQSEAFTNDVGRAALDTLRRRVQTIETAVNALPNDHAQSRVPLRHAVGVLGFPRESWTEQEVEVPTPGNTPPSSNWKVTVALRGDGSPGLPLFAKLVVDQAGNERWATYLADEQYIRIRCFLDAAYRVRDGATPIATLVAELERNDLAWDNYLQRGYPQFPWENLANDHWVSSAWNRPPSHQWILVHPTPGLLLDLGAAKRSELDAALLVHAVGHVWYDDAREWYFGASATVALTSERNRGLGYGVTLHVGNASDDSVLPPIDVGAVFHEGPRDDGWLVTVGVDVARLLAPKR